MPHGRQLQRHNNHRALAVRHHAYRAAAWGAGKLARYGAQQLWRHTKKKWSHYKSRPRLVESDPIARGDEIHSGHNKSKAVIWLSKKHKKAPNTSASNVYYTQSTNCALGSTSGNQIVIDLAVDFQTGQMANNTGSVVADPKYGDYAQCLFYMNPYQTTTSAMGLNSAVTTLNQQNLMYIHSISYEFQINNCTNANADIIMHGVQVKKEYTGLPNDNTALAAGGGWITSWMNNFNTYTSLAQAAVIKTEVSGVNTNSTVGYPTATHPGFSPWQVPAFRKMFKSIYKKEINLGPGAVHKFEIKVHVNKWVRQDLVRSLFTNNQVCIPYLTLAWFVIARGSAAQISYAGAPSTNQNLGATFATVDLACTCIRKIKFGFKSLASSAQQVESANIAVISGTTVPKVKNIVDADAQVLGVS